MEKMETKQTDTQKISNSKAIAESSLEMGSLYILRYGWTGSFWLKTFVGRVDSFTKRYSQTFKKEIIKDKRGEVVEEREVLKLNMPHYPVVIFRAPPQFEAERNGIVKRMFTNTLNPNNQFYFTDALIFDVNIEKDNTFDWEMKEMRKIPIDKVSNQSINIVTTIAESMMIKKNYQKEVVEIIRNMIIDMAINTTEEKQRRLAEVLEAQSKELPF